MLQSLINWLKAHATSLSSVAAVALTVIGTLLASDLIPTGSSVAHALGFIVSILTVLGFKALPAPKDPPGV